MRNWESTGKDRLPVKVPQTQSERQEIQNLEDKVQSKIYRYQASLQIDSSIWKFFHSRINPRNKYDR